MLYDAHVHAGMFPDFNKTITCALNSGIVPVCVSTSLEECSLLLKKLSQIQINLPVFAGVHPWYLKEHVFDEKLALSLLSDHVISGIGEFGLDSKCDVPLNVQIEALNEHLDFACGCKLPVNLHIRACHGELIRELKKYRGSVRGIIHNFTFSYELAKQYLDLGYILSVGSVICSYSSSNLCEVLKKVGIGNVVLETDADYEHTGDYDPLVLEKSYARLGDIFKLSEQRVELTLEKNLLTILGKQDEPGFYC